MKKKLLMCGLMVIASFYLLSCDDEEENNNSSNNGGSTTSNLSAEFVGASDCLGNALGDGTGADGADDPTIRLSSIAYKYDSAKGEVELNLENARMNCAAKPKMDITFSGDTIIFNAYNSDTSGVMAKCICLFNLTSKVKGVESKVYYIRPEKSTDAEDIQVLELSQKEEGAVYFLNATSSY